jgi:hypothetical protein
MHTLTLSVGLCCKYCKIVDDSSIEKIVDEKVLRQNRPSALMFSTHLIPITFPVF